MKKINLTEVFTRFSDHWCPKIVAELNGQHVKVAKIQGAFVWHKHENEDELFWVAKGSLRIEFRGHEVHLKEGEMVVVPRGVEHRPVADDEVHLVLFEPISTVNTGDTSDERTVRDCEWI